MMADKGVLHFSPAPPRPQGVAPTPSKAIPVPSWQRARDQSCAAVLAGEMCVVVTGLPGTGKTLLVDTVARALRSTGWKVATFAGRLPSETEFAALTGSAAILIDDADRLSVTEVRTLNRLRQCSVLLAGAPGLEKRCPADSRVTLAPLQPDEVAAYVELWLQQAGQDPDLVAETAIAQLAEVSAGIPRVLGILLSASLKSARADGAAQIEDHHVDHAAWHHVESAAARRLHRATSTSSAAPEPNHAKPAPAMANPELERRLSQAPFADASATEQPRSLLGSRVLALAGFGVAFLLAVAAGLLVSRHWSQWAISASSPARDNPAPASLPAQAGISRAPASPPVPEPAAERPRPLATESAPPAPPAPSAPPAEPVQAQRPAEPAPSPPQASPPIIDARPAPAAPAAAPVVASLPPRPAPEVLGPEVVNLLNQRGQQMIDLNDYSAARLLFGRAAESGSVRAMLALGRSYDPNVTGGAGSVADVDPAQAAQWYRKAAAMGSSDAASLLQQLERGARE